MKTTFHIPDRAVKLIKWGAIALVAAIVVMFGVAVITAANHDDPSNGPPDSRCAKTENWVVTDRIHGRVLYEQLDFDTLETHRFWISCPDI